MRILFLSRWYPYPADNGAKIRVYNLIKQLAVRHEVSLISFVEEETSLDRLTAMREWCERVEVVAYKRFEPGSPRALAGLFSPRPRSVIDTFSAAFKAQVEQLSRQTRFDVVIASQFDMAQYGRLIPDACRILEEVEISGFQEQVRRAEGALDRARKQLMWLKWRRYMREVLCAYDGCTVVSEPEIEPIHAAFPGYDPIAVIPNGADIDHFTGDFGRPEPNVLVHAGAMTYYPNFEAMKFFLGEIYSLIQAQCPEVQFRMAGRLDGVPVRELPVDESVTFAGYQPDIRPFVAQGWASVVPLRQGGGTRLKILESMALGTPVVATSRGAHGLRVTSGHDILIADEPRAFVDAVVKILRDSGLRETLSHNGRRTIEQCYDWRVIGHALDDFICEVARSKNAGKGEKRTPAR